MKAEEVIRRAMGKASKEPSELSRLFKNQIRCAGLTQAGAEIRRLAKDLPKRVSVLSYKRKMPHVWVVFLGGTGTGKSTLFNAFCGARLSDTGVERPKTSGPVLYAHRDSDIDKDFPLPALRTEHLRFWDHEGPVSGMPGRLVVLEHERENWSHLVLVDTPDLDSVELGNRQSAEDLYLLSDAVVFVTSQEKYADEVPFEFFARVAGEGNPYFFLINKVNEDFTKEDLLKVLGDEVRLRKERVWLIPYSPSAPVERISRDPAYQAFRSFLLSELSPGKTGQIRKAHDRLRAEDLRKRVKLLVDLLEEENRAARKWLVELEDLHQTVSKDFVREQRERFAAKSREYLREEIRRLFTRYDVLAKPRRVVKSVILAPFRFLRFRFPAAAKSHKEALIQIREKVDLSPVQAAVERFNLSVLENLSPSDPASPLFAKLRQPGTVLTDEEIKKRTWEEQDRLIQWLEETFRRLSREIPTGKKWGIYSTSILWGIILVSFETAVGGGFTVLDAALDSAVAPFVTKGAVELFAYHEIQKIARELAKRYQEGLLSVLHEQRDRYKESLESLTTPAGTLKSLRDLMADIERNSP